MKFFILALFITLDCGAAFAQTTAPAPAGTQVFSMPPGFVDSKPRPTFLFNVDSRFRGGFLSLTLTWGTGPMKDGVVVKPTFWGWNVTDIYKIGDVVTGDTRSNIYEAVYNGNDGKLSIKRDWDTGDKEDVAFKKSEANSFQWEVIYSQGIHPQTRYVGSNSGTFLQATALLENQGLDGSVGFPALENQNLFSNWTARTVLPTKPRIENFQFQ